MKVIWIEDHVRACELLAAAGAAAARRRYGIDLVLASSLMDAERKLRLERFDLVVLDLKLPDSADEEVTITRVANMGKFRLAIVSGSDKRQDMVDTLLKAKVDCSPKAVAKEDIQFADFVKRPETFRDFLNSLLADAQEPPETAAAIG